MNLSRVFLFKSCFCACAVIAQPVLASESQFQASSNRLDTSKIDSKTSINKDEIVTQPSVMLEPHGPVKNTRLKLASKDPIKDKDSPLYKRMNQNVAPPAASEFTPLANEMAELVGVKEQIKQLIVLNKEVVDSTITEDQRLKIEHKIDHFSSQVYKKVLKSNLEVDFVLSEITFEIGVNDYLLTKLNNKVQRNLLWANRLDAITNGVLWSLSSALGLRGANVVPSASTGIVAGAVPSTLELAALQFPVRQKIKKTATTNMLSFVFELPNNANYYLPHTVRNYLNSVPPGKEEILSRREQLIAVWHSIGAIPKPDSRGYNKWIKLVTGTYDNSVQNLTKNALEQRMRMLNQLKVTVFSMKRGLFELTNLI